ncbi:hypothetical protein GQ44DRAFT_793484 [Phaeosphaeriaceae sp. PMI808]|nr:hypothetical protein GQ44DRAFT_793484 [Phaeosphaeriaceae sp. PMI808]
MGHRRRCSNKLSIINESASFITGPSLLHEIVAPPSTATAVDFLGSKRRTFSYKSLHTLSNTLAQSINQSLEKLENASPIVPVFLSQGPELYIALLAILKAGKAFCPISLDTPVERLNFILGDISANLIITDLENYKNLRINTSIVTLKVEQEIFQEKELDPSTPPLINTNDLAYVLYTSGSTGVPKAVSVSHRAVTQSLLAHDRHIPHFARFLQFAAPTFDVSIFEIFFPWYRGCTLTGRTRAKMLDNLPETIRDLDIDAVELTPTAVSNLLEGRSSVPNLRLLLTIGEMLTRDVIDEYGSSGGRDSILWAMYGPTEAAIHCTLQPLLSATASTRTIGFPLDTVSAFIVLPHSEAGSPPEFPILPLGEEGELVVGGPQIAEGYLNRSELTAASFIHHSEYGYLYRTGDRARMCDDGTLECFGRVVEGQVKLRGQRVELGEIEQAIIKLEDCRAATVLVIEEVLVAFCATSSRKVLHEDVLQICKRWLPSIMIPTDIILMQRMPQLPSGKIDKRSLLAIHRDSIHRNEPVTKYSNNTIEHSVLDSIQHHIKQNLDLGSNLASVGLDSLQAIRLASVLRKKGYRITALQILSATTVEDLLQATKSADITNGVDHDERLATVGSVNRGFPELEQWQAKIACTLSCTPIQEAMLAETVARPKAYCNWIEVELSKFHTFNEIQHALHNLARGNEILRAGFYPTAGRDGTFVQVIWKELDASRIQYVSNFSRLYSLGSYESLLWPLSVQVSTDFGKPRLLFQIHHALYDGWSFDLILQDLGEWLDECSSKSSRPQYRKITHFYHEHASFSRGDDIEYWAKLLDHRPEISLPNLNGIITGDTATHSIVGHSDVTLQSLHEHSRELAVSPHVFFQAAIAFVMSLYVGSSDIIIGNVTSGRTIPVVGVEDIIGPCIATLPFRLRLDNLHKVRDVLKETQRMNRESLKHITLPLREILKAANVLAGTRLFDVLFVWQQPLNPTTGSSSSAYIINSADDLEFKITFEYEPQVDYISSRISFDPSTIPADQVKHLSRQIDEVVQLFLDDADCMTTNVMDCFSDSSRSIANPIPKQCLSHHGPSYAVEKWALTAPEKEAILFSHIINGVMQVKAVATYDALNRRSNQVARGLSGQGVRPGDLVGVIMEKSIDLYVAILAVLKLGAGYLPLVPDLPNERKGTILNEARVAVCIVDSSALIHAQRQASHTTIHFEETDFSLYADHNIDTPYNGTNVAYCIFTSGSTGVPKGVLVTQENLMSNLDHLSRTYPLSSHSRLLQSCSQAFDVSAFEIFFSWNVGICLCSASKEDLFVDLEDAIRKMNITHLSLTPTVAALIDPENIPKVEFLVTAGEALTEYVRRKWVGRGLYQGYGPSETTNICTVRPSVSPIDLINNIGSPFDNTSAFVLDPKSTAILPRGSLGELCFGGQQVFQGYLNQPQMTNAKVINHPIYGRIYRSGDMGVLLHDDTILFVSRMDDQVKIRGQRVELGEISSAVLDQGCVRDCVTLLLQRSQGPERLVSFWIPNLTENTAFRVLDVGTFRPEILTMAASLSHRLPTYMMPAHFIPVAQIPMTTQGKIDKRLLQKCFDDLSEENIERTTNIDDVSDETIITAEWELHVARILAETLQLPVDSIKRTSSFFNLGLDSVSAITLSRRLRKANLGDLAISTILKHSTIARLAASKDAFTQKVPRVEDFSMSPETAIIANENSRIQSLFDMKGTRVSKILPCTPLQEAMLASGHSTSGSSYSNVMVFTVHGDLSHLRECWVMMIQRHEILRTSFVATNDPSYAFAQVVLDDVGIEWGSLIWSRSIYQYTNHVIFDLLSNGKPPFWLAIAHEGQSSRLVFGCHHALYDGIAVQNLLKEVQEVYYHRKLPPPVSYNIYLQDMMSQDLDKADKFWGPLFQGFEPTSFPDLTNKIRREQASALWQQSLLLPLNAIRKACQDASISLHSVLLATWAKMLHLYTGERDVCFGNVVSGRAHSAHDMGSLVAPCFNTLPVRMKVGASNTNTTLVQQAHAYTVESFPFQLTPLRRIQNLVLKDGGRLFDTLVILQQPSSPLDSRIWTLDEDWADMDLPLVCEISPIETENKLKITLHYHNSILSEIDAKLVAETFDTSLAAIINQPHALVSATIGFPPRIRAESTMEVKIQRTETHFLHSDFEHNAQVNPLRIALDFLHVDGIRTLWSFETLNQRANDIAYTLIDSGARPEHIIPIHISKCPLFYASVLGVLKAGAAFAPVHPDLPEARRLLMLGELKSNFILYTKDSLPPKSVTVSTMLDVEAIKHSKKGNPAISGLTNRNLAYCIFTSGSTGVPKAVSMEHRSPLQTIKSSGFFVPYNTSSRLLQYAAISFDMCYFDCFLAWTFGFTLCSAEQNMMLDELASVINALHIDLLDLTPSVAASLIKSEIPGVRWLYCIGEPMLSNIVIQWESICVNSYGPTEAAFCTTIYPATSSTKSTIIGKPFPGTSFAVFGEDGDQPLPLLSIGELHIGGAQIARGYFGRPELTNEKFVSKCGQRFYRSGDLVRMLSDGNFEFVGRADDQIKIRGIRVELDEINHILMVSQPNIANAVTLALKRDIVAKEQLVSFLVTQFPISNNDQEETRQYLRQAIQSHLPPYMMPSFFLFVDRIPRSLAGKVDKSALTDIFRHSPEANLPSNIAHKRDGEHQWTELAVQIRDIFARLSCTALEDVSPETTIYQLGLDSISAVQIAATLRRKGYNAVAGDIMRYTTCLELARFIERVLVKEQPAAAQFDFIAFNAKYKSFVSATYDITTEEIAAIRPCTPMQRGMISQMVAKDGAVYINHIRLKLERGVNLVRMRQAWEKVMIAHQILRTGFVHLMDKEHPFGMIEYNSSSCGLPWEKLPGSGPSDTAEVWLEKLQRRAPYELHKPCWYVRVANEDDTKYLDLVIFHGLFDAQSLQLIFKDISIAYEGGSIQAPRALDSVIDSILRLSSEENEQGRILWTQMGEQTPPCRFPNLAPLRHIPEPPMSYVHQSIKSLSEIESACRQANTTLQAVGIASWLSLLSAYTGETRATCGVVLSGRSFEGAEHAVFPCINTVPISQTIAGDSSAILKSITALIAEVQHYQYTPLTNIYKLMGCSDEPLFDTVFVFQKLPSNNHENPPWSVVDEKASVEYAVTIELEPHGDYLQYRLTFMPHILPQEQAARILEQLDHLMQSLVMPTNQSDSFNTSIYSISPAKESTIPSDRQLLHELVELSATNHPQRIALEFAQTIRRGKYSSRSWTYSELDSEGNRVANLLISKGVRPGALVGVCFDKCPEASFAMLGVLKAGCAFVAIDPGSPTARQVLIVQDSSATLILSMETVSANIKDLVSVPILNLDVSATRPYSSTKPKLERDIDAQDRSYCLYTSGTTGIPKGCELTHENAVQALVSFQRLFSGHWNSNSRWLQFASFHFDVSVLEQYWSWSVGICVVSAPRDLIFEDLAQSISTLGITHIDLTPSLAQLLHPRDVPGLCKGVFITGGESLKQEILDAWGPTGVIYNGYGPTEATIGCTMYPRVPANGKPSNIGRQFDNVGTFVLQPGSDVPVLRGGIGELCISGKLVGKGYLNRDDLTKKSFPFLERFCERVYRTGDLVRILHDGTFDFLGRADDQIKMRGQRLEIGEINSVIRLSNESISDVATLVLRHPGQQKEQLVAFFIRGRANQKPNVLLGNIVETRMARQACHEKLPSYMVPTHFIPLSSLPLNINNKTDTKKLKDLYEALSGTDLLALAANSDQIDQVWSSQERKIRRVVKEELGGSEEVFDKDTSFFELGMDSISAISFVRAMKQAGFSGANASLILKHCTIRRLSRFLSGEDSSIRYHASLFAAQQKIAAMQHRHRHTVARSLSIHNFDIDTLAPCTPLQQGMIARSLESEDGLYFNTFRFKLSDDINHDLLKTAWQTVHFSIPILRTMFVKTEDGYAQAVIKGKDFPWTRQNTLKNELLEDCFARLKQKWLQRNHDEYQRPFEIIFLTASGKNFLLVHIFHALYDGVSIELIFNAAWDTYNRCPLSNDTPSFHDALVYGPLRFVEGAECFWQEHLTRNIHRSLPTLTSNPSNKPLKVSRGFDTPTTFESARRKLNVTAQAIAQACWLSVLQQCMKGPVTVGVVVSGRSIDFEGADRIIGPMFNTIPFQHLTQQGESWASVIKRVHDFNVAAHPYQHTGLRDINKWLRNDRSQPLFNSLFVYQVGVTEKYQARNENWRLLEGEAGADYPLAFEVEQNPKNRWNLTLVTQGHMSDITASNELISRFEEAIQQAINDPTSTVRTVMAATGFVRNVSQAEEFSANGVNSLSDFVWTDYATILRDTLIDLTGSNFDDVNESTSIFGLGLDSIDAIKLSSKLKKRGVNLPVSGIMRGLTIAKMLESVQTTDVSIEIERDLDECLILSKNELRTFVEQQRNNIGPVTDILPLTPLQEAMIAEMVTSGFTRYYNFDIVKIQKGTDIDQLRNAWTRVTKASPILRTCFVEISDPHIESTFAQVILTDAHDFWKSITMDEEPVFPSLLKEIQKEAMKSFQFEPPFHILHVKVSDQNFLIISIAHALYDGWSLSLLHTDVARAYNSQYLPRPDYQIALSNILSTSGPEAATFWEGFLSGSRPSILSPRPNIPLKTSQVVHCGYRESTLSATDITKFAKKASISVQTLGQSVFAIVLASFVRSLDIVFGSVLSGRDDDTKSQLLFPTMNTVAIRAVIHGTGSDMLRYVQDNSINIKQWQHFPLRKVLSSASLRRGLFNSLFIYQKGISAEGMVNGPLYTSVQGQSEVEYPVCIEMEMVHEKLIWRCAIQDNVFDEDSSKDWLRKLDQVMGEIVEWPDRSVIQFTSDGISVCGLPPFEEDRSMDFAEDMPPDHGQQELQPGEDTVSSIREVLSSVSGTPEHEFTGSTTIFHIGLDSISAIKVCSLLHQRHIILSVGEILQAGTIDKMALAADANSAQHLSDDENYTFDIDEAFQEVDREDIIRRSISEGCAIRDPNLVELLPVTAGQLYMLSMWLNSQGSHFYPEFVYSLIGEISFENLRHAWKILVDANPILRTYFITTQNKSLPYVQIIQENYETEVSIIDVTTRAKGQITHGVIPSKMGQSWATLFVVQTITGWDLKLKIQHTIYDGVSLPILMQQLQDICNGVTIQPRNDTLERLIATYSKAEVFEHRKIFWTAFLKGVEQHRLPQPTLLTTSRTEILVPGLVATGVLDKFARQKGVSLQAIILAAYAQLYVKITGTPREQDVVLGVYMANRSLPIRQIENAAIPTVNLLPLRIRSPLLYSITDSASNVQQDLQKIGQFANASASLFEISEWTGVKLDTFVNFLKLPVVETVCELPRTRIRINKTTQWAQGVNRIIDQPVLERSHEHQIRNLGHEVNGAYLVSRYYHHSSSSIDRQIACNRYRSDST